MSCSLRLNKARRTIQAPGSFITPCVMVMGTTIANQTPSTHLVQMLPISRDSFSFQTFGIDLTGGRISVGGDVHTGAVDSFTDVTAPTTIDILCTIEDIVEITTVAIVLGDGVVARFIVDAVVDTTIASDTTEVIAVDIEDVIAVGTEDAIVGGTKDGFAVSTDGNVVSTNDEKNERSHVLVDEDDRPTHPYRLLTPFNAPAQTFLSSALLEVDDKLATIIAFGDALGLLYFPGHTFSEQFTVVFDSEIWFFFPFDAVCELHLRQCTTLEEVASACLGL